MSLFVNENARRRFFSHLAEASAPVRFGALVGYVLKSIFGEKLQSIPVLRVADGPISALIAMHNAPSFVTDYQSDPAGAECTFNGNESWDLVIVGSGPGGAIVADKSAARGDSVLIVERGRVLDENVPHHTPQQMKEFFQFGGQEIAVVAGAMPFAQGKVWGGGSAINSGLYHRAPDKVKTTWAAATGIPVDSFDKSAMEIERRLNVQSQDKESLGIYTGSPIKQMGVLLGWEGGLIPRWRTYESAQRFQHHGVDENYLASAIQNGATKLSQHSVYRVKVKPEGLIVSIRGARCRHQVFASTVCLAAGTIGTPEILMRSRLAKRKDIRFAFHAMLREAATFEKPVNDLHDIDPHQIWSPGGDMKIGAAVATSELLASTLASKGVSFQGDQANISTFYISVPSDGKSGFIKVGKLALPYLLPSFAMKTAIDKAANTLREAIKGVGGNPLGTLSRSISTVHIFGSLPLGSTQVLDRTGAVEGTNGKLFVRDASLLPTAPLVNPQGPLMQLVSVLEDQRLNRLG